VTDESDDAWEAAQEGAELLAEGRHEEAVLELERLVARSPDNEHAWFFLGSANFELERWAKAMQAYVKALEIAPEFTGAMIHLGHALHRLGHYTQAIRLGAQVLARRPDDPDALYLLGACHFALGDEAAATRYLEAFLHTQPEVEAAIEAQGMLQVLRGEIVPADSGDEPPN
jgi:cytochrome c-type biogenesis protein CcmH/NrfG